MEREKTGGERAKERGPCPEQFKPPGRPGETDSQHHRLQGAFSSGKPSSDPPSVSCGPVGEEVLVLVKGAGGGSASLTSSAGL